ncbi:MULTISPECIES: CGNR zinc finger domain-containing protein [Streptomyces]|uniref:ABATE domain-containing protein n=1 Tax=Streptomyces morookaense TaxID=1970 RepID=A0A7Y7BB87_STRMO|nr:MULTISPECIES: CGNR zinc finger domain-containing protein [Streptomyces]MCC2280288.1 ABATE domain-containing protein [Streptomyces sp. ET3-23]NVK82369.1 ABATE domain-containing protein [Streptomyces morookaense]
MAAATAYALRFDSGRLCLDLVATVDGRRGEEQVDRLDTPERLRAWLLGAGIVPPGTPLDAVDTAWLGRFRAARDLLHRVVHAEVDGRAADPDLERVNALAATAPPAPQAGRGTDGMLVRSLAGAPDCGALLGQVARDAVDLLTDAVARGRLRRCAGEHCSMVYLDTSRGRRRRWCSSEVCGNRERVARHRRRAGAAAE